VVRRLALLVLVCLASLVGAHDLNLTGIRVVEGADHRIVTVSTPLSAIVAADHLPSDSDELVQTALLKRLESSLTLPLAEPHLILDRANDMAMLQVTTSAAGQVGVKSRLYPESAESKTLFVVLKDGKTTRNVLLTRERPNFRAGPTPWWQTAWEYGRMGVEHIATGLDHLAFVLGLMLGGKTLKGIVRSVTFFTLAHSLTLSLAALNMVHVSPRVVEPLIALSIVVVAAEAVFPTKLELRPFLAAGFGLVHGLGFAGALAESGMPPGSVPLALGTFNLGVELGQVAFILSLWWLLQWARMKAPRAVAILPWVIGAAGCYWLAERIFH
jgi:hydrogenase/urease accessory protein HupE